MSNLWNYRKAASAIPIDNIKLPKNFSMSWESMKAMLDAFKAGKTVADVILEVFQVVAPAAVNRTIVPALTLALVPTAEGSQSAASRASILAKAPASAKSPITLKSASKEPIAISESAERGSKEGTGVAPLDVPPLQAVGAIVIGGAASKRVRTSELATEGRAPKRARATRPTKIALPPFADKGKKVVEQLSSTLDNELLNAAEVTPESMLALVAKMFCNKMFGGTPDALDPHFLALISHLAYSTKQQAAFSTHFLDDLGDSLREMFLMVSHMLFSRVFLSSLTFLTLFFFFCGRPSGCSLRSTQGTSFFRA
ncbi:uncharacterized protein LOC122723509 [Manihot esculenta]|uniref:uncharacterized protein LOC122723509 n=1 Tax=Manihot esculenta TaxID=3983 RepID=UPI001CC37486|nr:uncharacterized protein LOC122723509 [Manihot esculenta]